MKRITGKTESSGAAPGDGQAFAQVFHNEAAIVIVIDKDEICGLTAATIGCLLSAL